MLGDDGIRFCLRYFLKVSIRNFGIGNPFIQFSIFNVDLINWLHAECSIIAIIIVAFLLTFKRRQHFYNIVLAQIEVSAAYKINQFSIPGANRCEKHILIKVMCRLEWRPLTLEEKFFYAIVINVNQLGHGSIVTLNIDDIQGVCFLGNLVQIVANAVELLIMYNKLRKLKTA